MDRSKLADLLNRKVVGITADDGLGIQFADGSKLAIYNDYSLSGLCQIDLEKLVGQRVISADESDSKAEIAFTNGHLICVDLRDQAFQGPEAMQFVCANGTIIVWS